MLQERIEEVKKINNFPKASGGFSKKARESRGEGQPLEAKETRRQAGSQGWSGNESRVGGPGGDRHSFSLVRDVDEAEVWQLEERGSHYRVLRKRFAAFRDQTPALRVSSVSQGNAAFATSVARGSHPRW